MVELVDDVQEARVPRRQEPRVATLSVLFGFMV